MTFFVLNRINLHFNGFSINFATNFFVPKIQPAGIPEAFAKEAITTISQAKPVYKLTKQTYAA